MRWFWIPCFFSVLGWAAEPDPMPTPGDSSAGPRPLAAAHYELLMEYSPFVKSMESAKITEKSPDLVVVGYGRMKGEDRVIVQQKENSEKRENIGSRYGSKDFPYRLLSVTNISDRKTFVAVLEDRNKKKYQIRYSTESSPSLVPTLGSDSGQPAPPSLGGGTGNPAGGQIPNPSSMETQQNLSDQIQALQARLQEPSLTGIQRENINKAISTKQLKLKAWQSPQDFDSPEITPEGQAP